MQYLIGYIVVGFIVTIVSLVTYVVEQRSLRPSKRDTPEETAVMLLIICVLCMVAWPFVLLLAGVFKAINSKKN